MRTMSLMTEIIPAGGVASCFTRLGFSVQGLGSRVRGLGFRFQGLGFTVYALCFTVYGFGLGV